METVKANQLLDALPDLVLVVDVEGRIDFANAAARRAFGRGPSPAGEAGVEGLQLGDPSLGLDGRLASACSAAMRGEPDIVETPLLIAGERRAIEFLVYPLSADGRVQQIALVGRDVERRARAERHRDQLFALVENSSDFIGMADAHAKPFYVNPAGRRMVGISEQDVPHTEIPDYYPPDQLRLVNEQLLPAMHARGYWSGDTYFRNFVSGAPIPVSDTHFVVRHPETGELIGYGTITRDVSEQQRTLELQEASEQKDVFLATLGHELRNPLAPLQHGLDLLESAPRNAELLDRVVPMMRRQLSHLVRLVDDLLDVSRVSRGKIELKRETFDLTRPVHAAIEQARPLIDARRHELRLHLSASALPVHGDLARLTQVVANLLSNAAKFTEAGGTITITTHREVDRAVVTVHDTGLGIPSEDLGRVFDLFAQVSEHRDLLGGGGLGIGLALSRQLVQMHGGTIEARSAGLGHGSEFLVRLPLSLLDHEDA